MANRQTFGNIRSIFLQTENEKLDIRLYSQETVVKRQTLGIIRSLESQTENEKTDNRRYSQDKVGE